MDIHKLCNFVKQMISYYIIAGERDGAIAAVPSHIGRQSRPNSRGFESLKEISRVALKFAITLFL